MALFKGKHKQNPASVAGSTSESKLRKWLGKKGRETQADAGSATSSAGGSQPQWERSEDGSKTAVPSRDPLKDHEELHSTQSLWDRAYDAIKKEDPQLVEEYNKLLSKELRETSA